MRVWQDLRRAARALGKTPGWTAAATLTLALGVAANTTAYTWLRATVLEPVPGAADPERLRVVLGRARSGDWVRISHPDYRDLASESRVFEGVLAQERVSVALGGRTGQPPESLSGALVSENYFGVLGIRPALGRTFRAEETWGAGAAPAAVVSDSLWERAFDRDRSVIGRSILLDGRPYTVVGVTPRGFSGSFLGIGVDVFVPLAQQARLDPAGDRLEKRDERAFLCLARLKNGVSDAQSRAALRALALRLNRDFPGPRDGSTLEIFPLSRSPWGGPAELGPILTTLAILAGLVLLIASANLASLLWNRALGRRHETAIRLALGAYRSDLFRQAAAEGLLLAALAAAAAAAATSWTGGLLAAFVPPTGFPVRLGQPVDLRTIGFAAAVSIVATFLFGVVPALAGFRRRPAGDLTSAPQRLIGAARGRTRGGLVGLQIALSLALLAAAALFLRGLAAGRRQNPGFDTDRLLLVQVKLFPSGYDPKRGAALLEQLQSGARALPDVRAAALARRVPLGFGGFPSKVLAVGGYAPASGEELRVRFNDISDGYLAAMGIAIRQGREFEAADRSEGEPVAVVNETFARRYFGNRSAIGGRVRVDGAWRRVIGVAADSRYERLTEGPLPFLFLPLRQDYQSDVVLHLRTRSDPARLLPAVRALVAALDPNLPLFEVQTMEEHLAEERISQRIGSRLLGAVGLLALLLSAIGVYALEARSVAERRAEIGLRMALGASPRQLTREFVLGGLRVTGAGVGLGLAAAFAVGRLVASRLPGVPASDPLALAAVVALMWAITLAAAYVPARRAARVDPLTALREG